MSVIQLAPDARDVHTATQSLLPWYVKGLLSEEERHAVQAHLQLCEACRAEAATERDLQEQLMALVDHRAPSPDAGLARLRQRMADTRAHPEAPPPSRAARGWRRVPGWIAGLLVLQGVALCAVLIVLAWPHNDETRYQGLSAPAAADVANADAVVMFRPDASETQIRHALLASGAQLAGGPTASHAYLLQLPRGSSTAASMALQRLRSEPFVTLAEPLNAGAKP
ncbi:MAG: zf-HC2 domain-containing protein [Burkholderiaceae bacterium]|nr:zf-HC2 domain-containing protein [Roseateles sp.]MBV8468396.1 zf-HC2 domain-containing protein [Burkholderiaceae bacterium]